MGDQSLVFTGGSQLVDVLAGADISHSISVDINAFVAIVFFEFAVSLSLLFVFVHLWVADKLAW